MLGKATQILDSSHEDEKTPVRAPDGHKLQLGDVKVEPHTDTNDTCDTTPQVCGSILTGIGVTRSVCSHK